MTKIILAINAGSSSVKISLFLAAYGDSPRQFAETQIDGLTSPPPRVNYTRGSKQVCKDGELPSEISTQKDAFQHMLDMLIKDGELTQIKSKADIGIACHRVVHGGDYEEPKIIDRETYHHLEVLTDLAPLHNSPALEIVRFCIAELPQTRNIAVFDSQFHHTIPEHIRTYPINQEIAHKNKLRKYGFHGISYSFITRSVAEFLGKETKETSLIILHLGSGASACAVRNGESWDTSSKIYVERTVIGFANSTYWD
jgi:acetate kinase